MGCGASAASEPAFERPQYPAPTDGDADLNKQLGFAFRNEAPSGWPRVKELIEQGASPNAVDINGQTVLHWCCMSWFYCSLDRWVGHLQELLAMKANPNVRTAFDGKQVGHKTPLQMCAFTGWAEGAKILLEHGAAVDCPTSAPYDTHATFKWEKCCPPGIENGPSPLQWAIMNAVGMKSGNPVGTVKVLIEYGADLDYPGKAQPFETPLGLAAEKGHDELVALLEGYGAASAIDIHWAPALSAGSDVHGFTIPSGMETAYLYRYKDLSESSSGPAGDGHIPKRAFPLHWKNAHVFWWNPWAEPYGKECGRERTDLDKELLFF